MTASTLAPLAADLEGGLRRLKTRLDARGRAAAADHGQDPTLDPEELLRALVETEINARDASNIRLCGKQACFPMVKTTADVRRM